MTQLNAYINFAGNTREAMGTTWEIRPEADLDEMVAQSEARRGVAK